MMDKVHAIISKTDCHYFYNGVCDKAACPFRHEIAAKGATKDCSSWVENGNCTFPHCRYRHQSQVPRDTSKKLCRFQGQPGGCKSENCPYRHTDDTRSGDVHPELAECEAAVPGESGGQASKPAKQKNRRRGKNKGDQSQDARFEAEKHQELLELERNSNSPYPNLQDNHPEVDEVLRGSGQGNRGNARQPNPRPNSQSHPRNFRPRHPNQPGNRPGNPSNNQSPRHMRGNFQPRVPHNRENFLPRDANIPNNFRPGFQNNRGNSQQYHPNDSGNYRGQRPGSRSSSLPRQAPDFQPSVNPSNYQYPGNPQFNHQLSNPGYNYQRPFFSPQQNPGDSSLYGAYVPPPPLMQGFNNRPLGMPMNQFSNPGNAQPGQIRGQFPQQHKNRSKEKQRKALAEKAENDDGQVSEGATAAAATGPGKKQNKNKQGKKQGSPPPDALGNLKELKSSLPLESGLAEVVPSYWSPESGDRAQLRSLAPDTLQFTMFAADFKKFDLKLKNVYIIENRKLWKRYQFEKEQMAGDGIDVNEKYLYHGTTTSVMTISEEGLDHRLSKTGFYGTGIYFSDNPIKAADYSAGANISADTSILVCRVLLGDSKVYPVGEYDPSLKREPRKDQPSGNRFTYDSVIGCPKGMNEYVIYGNNQVYVEFAITCNK